MVIHQDGINFIGQSTRKLPLLFYLELKRKVLLHLVSTTVTALVSSTNVSFLIFSYRFVIFLSSRYPRYNLTWT